MAAQPLPDNSGLDEFGPIAVDLVYLGRADAVRTAFVNLQLSGGRSSEAGRVQSSRLGHLGGVGAGVALGRADVLAADLANWRDRPHMHRGSTNQCNPRRRQGGDPLCSRLP